MVKFAFIVMYELRSINKTINELYKNIINYYNADVIILCQETFENDVNNIDLFDKNVVYKRMYKKPCTKEYFSNIVHEHKSHHTWDSEFGLQIYINLKEMSKVMETYKNDYDYFISLRTDIEFLFPLPPENIFEVAEKGIYSFDPDYCRFWGGWATGVFIHKDYIIDYLNCTYDVMSNNELIQAFFLTKYTSQEQLINFAMRNKNLSFKFIKNLNLYFIAETLKDRTTRHNPKIHPEYGVICKYIKQCSEANENLKLWNKGYRWIYENNEIFLKLNET